MPFLFEAAILSHEAGSAQFEQCVTNKHRLTRSLADFTRIVELFDANDVSFGWGASCPWATTSLAGDLSCDMLKLKGGDMVAF